MLQEEALLADAIGTAQPRDRAVREFGQQPWRDGAIAIGDVALGDSGARRLFAFGMRDDDTPSTLQVRSLRLPVRIRFFHSAEILSDTASRRTLDRRARSRCCDPLMPRLLASTFMFQSIAIQPRWISFGSGVSLRLMQHRLRSRRSIKHWPVVRNGAALRRLPVQGSRHHASNAITHRNSACGPRCPRSRFAGSQGRTVRRKQEWTQSSC